MTVNYDTAKLDNLPSRESIRAPYAVRKARGARFAPADPGRVGRRSDR